MKSGVNLRKVINKLSEIDFNAGEDRHLFGDLYEGILRELQSAGDSGEFYTPRAVTQFMTEMLNPQLGETVLDPACGTGGFLVCTVEHLKQQVRTPDERLRLQETVRGMEYKPLPFVLALTNLILHDVELPRIEYGDSLARQYDAVRERDRVNVILCNPPFGEKVVNNNEYNFPANFRTKEVGILFVALIEHLLKFGGRAAIAVPDIPLSSDTPAAQSVRKKLLENCNLHTIVRLPNIVPSANTQHSNLLFFEKGTPTKEVWYYEHRLPEGQKSYSKTKPIQVQEFEPIRRWWKDANPAKRVESDVAWRVSVETLKERGYDLDVKNPTKRDDDTEHTSAELAAMLAASMRKGASLLDEVFEKLSKKYILSGVICQRVKLGEILKRVKNPVPILPDKDYRLVTIRMHHKGVVQRGVKKGLEISSTMYAVRAGQFILSGIDARHGAFGIIPQELDGAIVTNDFWYFDIDTSVISIQYFLYLTATSMFDDICRQASDGTTNRVRLQAEKFFAVEILLPPRGEQERIVEQIASINRLQEEVAHQTETLGRLMQSALREAFGSGVAEKEVQDEV